MEHAGSILPGELSGIAHVLRPAGLHRDATIVRQPTVLLLPGRKILTREQVVGVMRRLGGHIDHHERQDKGGRRNFVDRGAGFREMDRRIQMRARMFNEPPPIKIEPIFLEVEFLLHLDARHSEEGREVGGHGMSEIDGRGESARRCCAGRVRRSRRASEGRRERPLDETTPRERVSDCFLTPGNAPPRYLSVTPRSPRSSEPKSIFSTGPARRTTSHSVICSAMPPVTGADPAVVASFPACSASPAHWPAALTRSAAVTGRNVKSFLPPEKVAQSGLRSNVSGLGTSVTLLRLRSEEHAATAEPNTVMASTCKILLRRCLPAARPPRVGIDPRARSPRFCVSILTLIFTCFPQAIRSTDPNRQVRERMTLRLLRPRPRLSDAHRDDPGNPEEHKIHRQKGWQARCRNILFNHQPDGISNEIPRDH